MSTLTLIVLLFTILVLSWVIRFLIERYRYSIKYEDEVNQRLRTISR